MLRLRGVGGRGRGCGETGVKFGTARGGQEKEGNGESWVETWDAIRR
jgi:hypothetical protein